MSGRLDVAFASRAKIVLMVAAAGASLAACATAPAPTARLADASGRVRAYNRPYEVRGRWYTPAAQPGYDKVGVASWYSYESPSRTTADGEPFDVRLATAAHTTLPIPSWIEVTNLDNGRSAKVRLNDRGPFVAGRILDVSRAAALELGFLQRGTARVRVRYLGPAEPLGGARTMWAASSPAPEPRPARDALRERARLVMAAEDAPPPRPTLVSGPTMAQAEVDKDLADFGGDEPQAVMAPVAAAAVTATSMPPRAAGPGFAIQAGAFSDRSNAERAAERLSSAGATSVRPLARGDGAVLYRVLVGGFGPQADPASARAQVAALGFVDAKVVTP